MSPAEIQHQLLEEIAHLAPDQQLRLLELARTLHSGALTPGMNWHELQSLRGIISEDEAASMKKAIEEECERVDPEGW